MKTGYKALLNETNYLKNLVSIIINRFGDSIDMLAFSWLIFHITGSAKWTAIMFGVNILPSVVFTPFAGVLVERMNKKHVIIAADLIRAVLVCVLIALYVAGILTPHIMLTITFLMSTAEAFRLPTAMPLVAKLVPKEKYSIAIGLNSSLQSLAEIIGVGLAGLVIGLGGIVVAMLIDVFTFIISAAIMLTVRISGEAAKDGSEASRTSVTTLISDFRDGIRYVAGVKLFVLLLALMSFINLMLVPLNALFTPYISGTLGLPAIALSIVMISLSLGTSLGALIYPWLSARFSRTTVYIGGGILFSLDYLGFVAVSYLPGVWEKYIGLALCNFVCSMGIAQLSMVSRVSFMERVDPAYLARLSGVQIAVATAAMPAGAFVIAGFASFVSSKAIFAAFAVLSILFYIALTQSRLFKDINTPPKREDTNENSDDGGITNESENIMQA